MENINLQKEAEKNAKREFDLLTSKIPLPTSIWYREEEAYKMFCEKGYIAGATSKYVEVEKLKFGIKVLKDLDGILSHKKQTLDYQKTANFDKATNNRISAKISGINLSRESLRRLLKELEQQLKELNNE
jgi:hypothetical protein